MTETPHRFLHRTEEVEAVQWTGDNADTLRTFCGPDFDTIDPEDRVEDPDETAAVRTHPHGGWLGLKPADWVLKHGEHRFTALRDAEFQADWEPATVPVSSPPPDQTADRDRYAEVTAATRAEANRLALAEALGLDAGTPWAEIRERVAALAVPPPAARAAVLREAADRYAKLVDENEAYDREHGQLDDEARLVHGTVRDVVAGLRRMAAEPQQPECTASVSGDCLREAGSATACDTEAGECVHGGRPGVEAQQPDTATPCGPAPSQCDAESGEPCADHERQAAHAEGEHCFCGPECEVPKP